MSQTYAGQPIESIVIIDKTVPRQQQSTFSTGATSSSRPQAQTFTTSGPYRDASGKFARRPVTTTQTPKSTARKAVAAPCCSPSGAVGGAALGFSNTAGSSLILDFLGLTRRMPALEQEYEQPDPTVPVPVATSGKKNSLNTAVDNAREKRIICLCLNYSRALINNTDLSAEELDASNRWAYREPYNALYTEAMTRYGVTLQRGQDTTRLRQLMRQIGSLEALNLATELFASYESVS